MADSPPSRGVTRVGVLSVIIILATGVAVWLAPQWKLVSLNAGPTELLEPQRSGHYCISLVVTPAALAVQGLGQGMQAVGEYVIQIKKLEQELIRTRESLRQCIVDSSRNNKGKSVAVASSLKAVASSKTSVIVRPGLGRAPSDSIDVELTAHTHTHADPTSTPHTQTHKHTVTQSHAGQPCFWGHKLAFTALAWYLVSEGPGGQAGLLNLSLNLTLASPP